MEYLPSLYCNVFILTSLLVQIHKIIHVSLDTIVFKFRSCWHIHFIYFISNILNHCKYSKYSFHEGEVSQSLCKVSKL